jgi:hypothetical protein
LSRRLTSSRDSRNFLYVSVSCINFPSSSTLHQNTEVRERVKTANNTHRLTASDHSSLENLDGMLAPMSPISLQTAVTKPIGWVQNYCLLCMHVCCTTYTPFLTTLLS